MAVRSINLKMILGRGEPSRRLRESLWLSHSVVNEAVAEIERVLLLCRGRGYAYGDGQLLSAEEVQQQALAFARQVQTANGKANAGSDGDVLAALGQLYEALVPSVLLDERGNPLKGDAQGANAFAGPMMDPRSEGFQSVFAKILQPLPAWVAKMTENSPGWERESTQWLESPDAQRLQYASGSPPSWVRRLRRGQPWQEAFLMDQEKKRKETSGVPVIVQRLKAELALLPLMRPPITSRFEGVRSGLTPWDRLALRLAVAHLLSWESWNHRAAAEHLRVQQRLESASQEAERFGDLIRLLRQYEAGRHEQLKRVALATDENPFRIGQRSIRAWDRVREQWCGPRGDTRTSRLEVLAALQTKLRGKFGDPELFRWLAADGRECLWREQDPLPLLARLNSHAGLLRRKKERALYTPPDAREHPRWTNYEAEGGSNLRTYKLAVDHSALAVGLPLLTSGQTGLREETFAIPLARSGQLESPAWNGLPAKQKRLTFRSAHQDFSASLGGSEVLLSRRHLENRETEELAHGDLGPVWFKLVLEVDSKAPQEWLDVRGRVVTPPIVRHFNTGRATQSRHAASLQPGLRVLAVDLGLRSFAACSVFELVEGKPRAGLAFSADADRDLWARHERSFLLTLPGETPDTAALAARRAAYDQLGLIRRDVNRLKDLLRLQVKATAEARTAALEDLRNSIAEELSNGHAVALTTSALDPLEPATAEPQPLWEGGVKRVYGHAVAALSEGIRTWRRQTRPRAQDAEGRKQERAYAGGKSVWAIEYLQNVRRLLQGWSLHGRRYGEINRADRQKLGTFAARLLEHINALKEDRVKAGSDLIVQAAGGLFLASRRAGSKSTSPVG